MPISSRPIAVACASLFQRLPGWHGEAFPTANRHSFNGEQASWSYISRSWLVPYILAMLFTEAALRFSCAGGTIAGRYCTAKSCEGFRAFFQRYRLGFTGARALSVSKVNIYLPDGSPLLTNLSFEIPAASRILISGPSGAGKSTLLRTLCGIWPYCDGSICLPAGDRTLFFPQKPYLPLGSLRDAVCYPGRPFRSQQAGCRGCAGKLRHGRVCRPAGEGGKLGVATFAWRAAALKFCSRVAIAPALAFSRRGDLSPRRRV